MAVPDLSEINNEDLISIGCIENGKIMSKAKYLQSDIFKEKQNVTLYEVKVRRVTFCLPDIIAGYRDKLNEEPEWYEKIISECSKSSCITEAEEAINFILKRNPSYELGREIYNDMI